jgi:hypothetical protein
MLFALIAVAASQTVRTLPADIPTLNLVADHASVTLRTDPGATETVVTATPVRWSEGCMLDFTGSSQEANVTVVVPETFGAHCKTEIDVAMAGYTKVTTDIGRGSVHFDEVAANADIALGQGRVTGTTRANFTRIELQRGRVVLEDLAVPVDVDVAVGGVLLEYDEAIAGTVASRVGLGRNRIRFPYGIWLDKEVDTVVGRTFTAIPTRTSSDTHLVARAGLGSVRVETVLTDELGDSVADSD